MTLFRLAVATGTGLALALTSTSCSSGRDAGSDAKIVGGSAVESDRWPGTVALTMGGSLCTGTLVAPNLVITAAHCLDSLPQSSPVTVIFGNRESGGRKVKASKFAVSPDYRDDAVTDIAYVKLSESVDDVEIIKVLTDKDEIKTLLKPGAKSVLVGFGTTNSGSIGVKHEVTTVVGPSQQGALFIGGSGRDACQGDSGGPAYGQLSNGEWRVYGITSRGNGCGGGGLLARMHDGLCWIQRDSGVAVRGSKLDCPGVPTLPDEGDDVSALSLLLAASSDDDAAAVAVAAARGVARVALCYGNKQTCLASRAEDVALTKHSKETADRSFFKSSAAIDLTAGLEITMLAFDGSGGIVDARAVALERL